MLIVSVMGGFKLVLVSSDNTGPVVGWVCWGFLGGV